MCPCPAGVKEAQQAAWQVFFLFVTLMAPLRGLHHPVPRPPKPARTVTHLTLAEAPEQGELLAQDFTVMLFIMRAEKIGGLDLQP